MLKTTANKITVFRIILIPVFLVLAYRGYRIAALCVYLLACLSDMADGYVARHYNQITNFGKFMDPLADKMLVLAAMCFFVDADQMPGWVVAIVLFREFAVSGLRLIAAEQSLVIAAAWSGKIKTAVTMVCLALMLVFPVPAVQMVSSILIVATTIYSGVEYFWKNWSVFQDID
ncbi:MAG: CDP-diacylglycerol--glycerol-3-phosphate 3-phosphatidyltransferase [Oscillospiraceae bacterium]|nr:CDP-diacylglycerol--glycerol-3-phosphate 3-phosphatidyltransferase [Oscillospiraceae bacterium]